MPWLIRAAFGARTPIAEFMPRLRETAPEARFPSPNSDHDRGERRWKRVKTRRRKRNYLAGGNHARSASSRRRYYAVRLVRRWRRSPWALDRDNQCCVIKQASNRTRASSEIKRGAPDGVVDGAVPPSSCRLPLRNVPGWRARVFPLGLWAAPKHIRGAGAGAEEAGKGGIPPS